MIRFKPHDPMRIVTYRHTSLWRYKSGKYFFTDDRKPGQRGDIVVPPKIPEYLVENYIDMVIHDWIKSHEPKRDRKYEFWLYWEDDEGKDYYKLRRLVFALGVEYLEIDYESTIDRRICYDDRSLQLHTE